MPNRSPSHKRGIWCGRMWLRMAAVERPSRRAQCRAVLRSRHGSCRAGSSRSWRRGASATKCHADLGIGWAGQGAETVVPKAVTLALRGQLRRTVRGADHAVDLCGYQASDTMSLRILARPIAPAPAAAGASAATPSASAPPPMQEISSLPSQCSTARAALAPIAVA